MSLLTPYKTVAGAVSDEATTILHKITSSSSNTSVPPQLTTLTFRLHLPAEIYQLKKRHSN